MSILAYPAIIAAAVQAFGARGREPKDGDTYKHDPETPTAVFSQGAWKVAGEDSLTQVRKKLQETQNCEYCGRDYTANKPGHKTCDGCGFALPKSIGRFLGLSVNERNLRDFYGYAVVKPDIMVSCMGGGGGNSYGQL